MTQAQHTPGPFKAAKRDGYWVLVNQNDFPCSYPTTKAKALEEARFMNAEYAKIVAEDAAIAKARGEA